MSRGSSEHGIDWLTAQEVTEDDIESISERIINLQGRIMRELRPILKQRAQHANAPQ
jgi:hypothetical protein